MEIDFSGQWNMTGFQVNVEHSAWEAELILYPSGKLDWRETKGANVGARRTGNWIYDGKVFRMSYVAPVSGLVKWESESIYQRSMNGVYSTPYSGPQPSGWGGKWSANKV